MVNALKLPQNHLEYSIRFNDISDNYPYKFHLNAAAGAGIITGYSDNTFRPKNNALRSEAAVIIKRCWRRILNLVLKLILMQKN